MANHPNRSLTDVKVSIIKGMLLRGDAHQSIVACFGGDINPGRVAEIHNSMTREEKVGEASLTSRARLCATAEDELPPPRPYSSPYDILRSKAALKSIAQSLRATIEKAPIPLAMIERNLDP